MVISLQGKRQVGKLTSAERGKNISILFCMSPAGIFVPPLFVFPRKRMNMRFMINAPEGSVGVAQHNGWMDGENFLVWLKIIDYARANHVHLLSLPPLTSHKLQPLDRTFMKPFKQAYSFLFQSTT